MTDPHNERGGRVLSTALTAVLLVLAGLGLMAWEDSGQARAPLAFFQLR